jgi:hypothetical protein
VIFGTDSHSKAALKYAKESFFKLNTKNAPKVTSLQPLTGEYIQTYYPPFDTPKQKQPIELKIEFPDDTKVASLEAMQGLPCPLANATKLYQPVRGSGEGTVYFVIAMCSGLNIAARCKGGTLSIRVEGFKLESYANKLLEAGLDNHGHYASMHVKIDSDIIAKRVIGSVLVALDLSPTTPLPIFSIFNQKGV